MKLELDVNRKVVMIKMGIMFSLDWRHQQKPTSIDDIFFKKSKKSSPHENCRNFSAKNQIGLVIDVGCILARGRPDICKNRSHL